MEKILIAISVHVKAFLMLKSARKTEVIMAIREIVIFPDERLRLSNSEVSEFGPKLKSLTDDMFETMYAEEGIGLAAPQIGINQRLVVIDIPDDNGKQGENQLIMVNPEITAVSDNQIESEEGCLSVPGYQDKIKRFDKVSVSFQDIEGNRHSMENVEGLLAICMQHEIEHLSGKLFIDHLSRLKRDRLKKKFGKILKDRQSSKE